jgi:predicted dehydrogenase
MYDVFRFLAGAPAVSISATAIDPGPAAPFVRTDNFCATLRYGDGTLANLVYTALGPKQGMGKERIEVFCGGEAYVIDDFRVLTRSGEMLWESAEVDKGHAEELGRFGDAIASGADAPIPVSEMLETSAVALHVEDLLRS